MEEGKEEFAEAKKKVLAYKDLWGCQIIYRNEIEAATSIAELCGIIDRYEDYIENMANDAKRHLHSLKNRIRNK